MGRPPPIIRAMPERKRFFSVDPFPYIKAGGSLLILEAVENLTWLNRVLFSISRGLEIFGKFWRFL